MVAFGILRGRQTERLVMPVALKTAADYQRACTLVPDRFFLGGQEFLMSVKGCERAENNSALPIQIGFLLRECPPLPEWLRQRELYGLPVMTICVEDIPGAALSGSAYLTFQKKTSPPMRRNKLTDWELTKPLTELSELPY